MTDMRVGSLSTDRWVETRLGAKYHDKLPPQNKPVIDGKLPCLYIFSTSFLTFKEIQICLNTVVYKSWKYIYGLFKMFVLDGIDHSLFCYLTCLNTLYTSYLGGKNHFHASSNATPNVQG